MTDVHAERRAYFAALATPDLIVCATVERASFSSDDLQLILEELRRRGVEPSRLAQPVVTADATWSSIAYYQGPLPTAGAWWSEGWALFKKHFRFLALLTLVLMLPEFLLTYTIGEPESWELSFVLLAKVFLAIAFDSLVTAATLQGLCRHMRIGHCSVGRAIALGLEKWGWVFFNTFKALAIAFGIPFLLITLSERMTGGDGGGLAALGVVLAVFPGVYLFLRYVWVQPLSALDPSVRNPLAESKRLMSGLYGRVFLLLLIAAMIGGLVGLLAVILAAILPGQFLEGLVSNYVLQVFNVVVDTVMLAGYLHVRSAQSQAGHSTAAAPSSGDELPPPPPL
jgi:hypothetical protein